MAGHTFIGKRKLCYTNVPDFTNVQGIGHDPLYRRYDSVNSVVKTAIAPLYQHFLAAPQYLEEEDQICWYIDEWTDNPTRLCDLSVEERRRYETIKLDTITHYRQAAANLNGEELQILAYALVEIDKYDDRIYCADGKVFAVAWGMSPDTTRHAVVGSIIHDFKYTRKHKLTFDAGDHGTLESVIDRTIQRPAGATLEAADVPELQVEDGFRFEGWRPAPVGHVVATDTVFRAVYSAIQPPAVPPPVVSPPEVESSTEEPAEEQKELVEEQLAEVHTTNPPPPPVVRLPWYKRFWLWLIDYWHWLTSRGGCLQWLLTLLLALLFLMLLCWLLDGCHGCTRNREINGVVPIDTTVVRDDGTAVENNRYVRPITGEDGRLPEGDRVVAPITDEDGNRVPIVDVEEGPDLVGNRLFLFMEKDNGNLDGLARDFKTAYPGDQYSIIGFDREIKMLVIQVPENERSRIREEINSRIPSHKFLVFDEQIYEIQSHNSHGATGLLDWGHLLPHTGSPDGWHLDAIHLRGGWQRTQGDSTVRVAIVDDGIEAVHPMFAGRIADAYNVFTQDNHLSMGQGHGTHTAALAVGSADFFAKGASGVAPKCTLIPIQVFDNGQCPLSALVAGVMYAVHHDADVVNISIAPQFQGLNQLPVGVQDLIAHHRFNNMEVLWNRISNVAASKRCILVFAAGNDNILASVPPENRNESSIVVAAVDHNLHQTEFTNYGSATDISAPGTHIFSAFPRCNFMACDGTSMAAPIVTGAVALMKSLKNDLTVEQARNVLYATGLPTTGDVPPMVVLDKALDAVKRGDFALHEPPAPPPVEDDDLVSRARDVGQSGKLKVTMLWNMKADIDLHVLEPNGNEIYYRNKRSSTGGYLDVDNTNGGSGSAENVYWDRPLSGDYIIAIEYYGAHRNPEPRGSVDVVVFPGNDPPRKYTINLTHVKQRQYVTRFHI